MEKQNKIDRITNLPWDVLDTILGHLSLKDAARTSVLSKKWKYKWTGLSRIVFDEKCLSSPKLDAELRWGEIMKILSQVQSSPSCQVEKFKLAAFCCPDHSDLDCLILYLTERGLKELIIKEFRFFKSYKVPLCLFSCSLLTRLELFGCLFKLPPAFTGFNSLKYLSLTRASIQGDSLERLIRSCPVLETLMLFAVSRVDLKIHNPNLKYLKIDTDFLDICLENCPLLTSVQISRMKIYERTMPHHRPQPCKLVRVLDSLKNAQKLALSSDFLNFAAVGNVPERLPTMLNNLSSLELMELRFASLKEMVAAFCILRSAPNLNNLLITVACSMDASRGVLDFLREQSLYDLNFSNLRHLMLRGICCTKTEYEFIKLMLLHAPVLETMSIVRYGGERIPESHLLDLDRASENLKYLDVSNSSLSNRFYRESLLVW
ncbi:hypothetical protein ACFE04_005210 [Oxalis oulophora]